MNKLTLIEGLPGSGKTTISQWIYDLLQKRDENAILLLENKLISLVPNIKCRVYDMTGQKPKRRSLNYC